MNKYRIRIYRTVESVEEVYREVFALTREAASQQADDLSNEFDIDTPQDRRVEPDSDNNSDWYVDEDATTLLVGIEPSDDDAEDNAALAMKGNIKLLEEVRTHLEKGMGDNIDEPTMDLIEKINSTIRSLT